MSNQWKFDEDFVEYDIFEIAGLIEGDNLVYLSPLFTTFSIFHVWFNISFNFLPTKIYHTPIHQFDGNFMRTLQNVTVLL